MPAVRHPDMLASKHVLADTLRRRIARNTLKATRLATQLYPVGTPLDIVNRLDLSFPEQLPRSVVCKGVRYQVSTPSLEALDLSNRVYRLLCDYPEFHGQFDTLLVSSGVSIKARRAEARTSQESE